MELETFSFPDFQPNFLNLSLLICQLFAGGNFRMAHILYHPEVFDDRLLKAIDSTCPLQIPMMTIDISAPGISSSDQNQRTDHILQLIFLPRDQLKKSMDRINGLLTFYRIFIFTSDLELKFEKNLMHDSKFIRDRNSSSLLLIHNNLSGATKPYLFSGKSKTSLVPVDLQWSQLRSGEDMFDSALGAKVHDPAFGVAYLDKIDCKSYNTRIFRTLLKQYQIYGRFYYTRFNMTFIDEITLRCIDFYVIHRYVRPIPKQAYNELSSDVERITMEPK